MSHELKSSPPNSLAETIQVPPQGSYGSFCSSGVTVHYPESYQSAKTLYAVPSSVKLEYNLPRSVTSIKDGWRQTCQSGAVVSSLLAALSTQLLVFFKADSSYSSSTPVSNEVKHFLILISYAALFLNVLAALYSFIIIDNIGEISFRASTKADAFHEDIEQTSRIIASQNDLLKKFGAGKDWNWMIMLWLFTFYAAILLLITSVLTYAMIQESTATRIAFGCIAAFTGLPALYFIFIRPLFLSRLAY